MMKMIIVCDFSFFKKRQLQFDREHCKLIIFLYDFGTLRIKIVKHKINLIVNLLTETLILSCLYHIYSHISLA